MQILKVPQWITARKGADDMDDGYDAMPPPIAMLPPPSKEPRPEISAHDDELTIMQRAAALHAQLKRSIETAQVELAESVLGRQGDQEKIKFLEKENAELRLEIATLQNTIATLQTELLDKNGFLNTLKDINDKTSAAFDRLGVKGAAKKERKPKAKKERKGADQPAQADG